MAIQLAVSTRNARLEAIETDVGAGPTLKLRTGAPPTPDCAAADTGTVVATMVIPTSGGGDWMAAAGTPTAGQKTMAGTWQVTAAAAGTIGHFRIYTSGGVCKIQGICGLASGDMQLDNNVVTLGQTITVTNFTLIDPNG